MPTNDRDILKQKLILSNKNQYFFSCPGLVFIHYIIGLIYVYISNNNNNNNNKN